MVKKAPATTAEIREWAMRKQLVTSNRGRLSADVIKAYQKSHPTRVIAS
jgi:hypothetical protein